MPKPHRIASLDYLRGAAVCAMVIYHQVWNLAYFGILGVDVSSEPSQRIARLIGSTFLLLVGISLHLSYQRYAADLPLSTIRRRLIRRGLIILGWGLVVSGATALVLPSWVAFGILHLIGVSIVLSTPFLGRARYALAVGAAVILLGYSGMPLESTSVWLLPLGMGLVPRMMVDYYPIVPWSGVVLIGLFVGEMLFPQGAKQGAQQTGNTWLPLSVLRVVGQNSLLVYLVHQPLLFGLTYVIWMVLNT